MAYRFYRAAEGTSAVTIHFGGAQVTLPRQRWFPFAVERVAFRYSEPITAANIPGVVGEILISLPISWPAVWHPTGMSVYEWRTFTYPVFCLPAWWFVGRALDGLLGRRRVGFPTLFIGSTLSLVCLVILLGLTFGISTTDRAEVVWVFPGLAFWTLGFGVVPMAWFRQKRRPAVRNAGPIDV